MNAPIRLVLSDDEVREVLQQCQKMKQSFIQQATQKKERMRRCYAYTKSQFYGDDLLPIPAALGAERDNNTSRPQIFIPATRTQVKQLYSQLKLTLLPNDTDYFRVRGLTEAAAHHEQALTEALRYLFRQQQIPEKIGQYLFDLVWSGNAVAIPTLRSEASWAWDIDPETGGLAPVYHHHLSHIDLEILDPLHFYVDPVSQHGNQTCWGYFAVRTLQHVLDTYGLASSEDDEEEDVTLRRQALSNLAKHNDATTQDGASSHLYAANGLALGIESTAPVLSLDRYFCPVLKTTKRTLRNVMVAIASDQILLEVRPNLFPGGLQPAVFSTWMQDKGSPYGTGPVEDMLDLQRLINILYNYQIETFARIGNRFIVRDGVDLTQFWGIAGGIATTPNPREDMVPITGDYAETVHISNLIGTLKAEADLVTGGQQPFQGSSKIDFKKTATEIQLLQENSLSVMREVVEHVANMGIQPILERLMRLAGELYQQPFTFRRHDASQGCDVDCTVDLSLLRSGLYKLELTGINPAQSTQQQISSLMQLLDFITQNPRALHIGEPIIRQIASLWGLKNAHSLLDETKQRLEEGK
jgi:hypothetical protein